MKNIFSFFFIFLLTSYSISFAGGREGKAPHIHYKETDKCPICNMFVHKFPEWVAQISFKDSTYVAFDGPKDMFAYYLNMSAYSKKMTHNDIEDILVLDYYNLKPINAKDAFYVAGSDVFGPMGRELVPFDSFEAANEFMVDHHGEKVLKFDEITRELVEKLRQGQRMMWR